MSTPSQYQISLQNATWVDVNTQYTQNNLPDRVPDHLAIVKASLFNLFHCAPGQRARIFQPEYGSLWIQFIHEPITDITAAKMQIFLIQAIARWEPRITLDQRNTFITADTSIPGYIVRIAFSLPNVAGDQQIQFQVSL